MRSVFLHNLFRKLSGLVLRLAVAAFFCMGLFMQCARQMTPTGGPRDSIPPRVVSMKPLAGATRFTDKRIFIEFDEYIQLKDQVKEFYTSPFMKKIPTLTQRGRGVQIDIKDTLLENQTYSLNFGSTIRDNNEGNILYGLRYVFSTGDEIDSMLMTGYTENARTGDSLGKSFIFFFEAAADSMPEYDSTLLKGRPVAVARSENNGIFIAQNLKPIPYRVYAVQDKNNNQQYDPGVDMVGFVDGSYNPAEMPDFAVWLDSMRHYPTADPQLYFRMFLDKAFARQNLRSKERPGQFQAVLQFSAANPEIRNLTFEGIAPENIITEYMTPGHDTISFWFHVPAETLPDTIKGEITYMKHDSINRLVEVTEPLALSWQYVKTKEELKEEKERERAEKAGEEYIPKPKPNPFRISMSSSNEQNPETNLPLEFDMPLVAIDSPRISVTKLITPEQWDSVPYTFQQDTANMRRWTIAAEWEEGSKYCLFIPSGVFENVAGYRNDTIRREFTILKSEDYSTLIVNVIGKDEEAEYVLQLLDGSGRQMAEKRHVRTGSYTFRYLPEGEVRLRVIEDLNRNGKWDGGDLIKRMQPELSAMYLTAEGDQEIPTKVNWEITIDANMNELFVPLTMDMLIDRLNQAEWTRVRKLMELRAKQAAEKARQGETDNQQSGGGLGIGSALSGARDKLGTVVNTQR